MNQYKILIEFLNFLNGMISEKELVLSHSLIELLETMDHPLAKFLLDAHQAKDDLGDSYIDIIKDKNDFVSYIGKSVPGEGETEWTSKKRQSTKIGRLLRALLLKKGMEVNDKAIEDFANKFKVAHSKMFSEDKTKFELFKGEEIREWYNENKYYKRPDGKTDSITLYNSCMRYEKCSRYFNVYTTTPNVSLLALIDKETNTLMARSILWENIEDSQGDVYTFMDRVYSCDDETLHMMIDHAKSNKWVYKTEQSYHCQNFHIPDGSIKRLVFKIKLASDIDWIEVKKPYMDTIKYLLKEEDEDYNDVYYLINSDSYDHVQEWNQTDGGPNSICDTCGGDGSYTCSSCEGEGSYDCSDCDGDGMVDCPDCDGDGKIDCTYCEDGKYECGECSGTGDGNECDTCEGKGEIGDECEDCKGKGIVLIDEPQLSIDGVGERKKIEVKCKACEGVGKLNIEECSDCDGKGHKACEYCVEGYNECSECEGEGKVKCDNDTCDGYGKVFCDYCSEGRRECYECDGRGTRECDDCN